MRYLIAYMLSGVAKLNHQKLSDEIAQAFRLTPVRRLIEPHLTLKVPFETDRDLADLRQTLADFVCGRSASSLILGGYGTFGGRVVYQDVQPSVGAGQLVMEFLADLGQLPWLKFEPFDLEDKKLHATLAYPTDRAQARKIIGTLPAGVVYPIRLDNLTLLVRGPEKWEVLEEYPLT
ncbi:MAG: 2'-5' RNA ligase family protein [Candidatus Vogelbacteria bacterium]|nr:2'-5' RNA ligase family protein [Candidatus Vogelbacteria bacterium]